MSGGAEAGGAEAGGAEAGDAEEGRPFLTVYVFGSKGSGKSSVKRQWCDSSQFSALSEVADVHVKLEVRWWWLGGRARSRAG